MPAYYIILAILGVISLVMSIPDVAIVVLFGTLGLAYPLLFISTIFLYMLCLLPSVLLWEKSLALGLVISGACFVIAAVTPSEIGRRVGNAILSEHAKGNISLSATISARTVEIIRKDNSNAFIAGTDMCGPECRSLLLSGQVDWVRNIKTHKHSERVVSFHKRFIGKNCQVPGAASIEKACAIPVADPGTLADISISFKRSNWQGTSSYFVQTARRRDNIITVEAISPKIDGSKPIYRRTNLHLVAPVRPTVLRVSGKGMSMGGLTLKRENLGKFKISLRRVLQDLGFNPGNIKRKPSASKFKKGPDVDMTRELIAVLNLPGQTVFKRDQAKPITDWITIARNTKNWTPRQLDLLIRIIREKRYLGPSNISQIFSRNKVVAQTVLPTVLDVLAADEHAGDYRYNYAPARSIAYRLDGIDSDLFKQYATKIIDLSQRHAALRSVLGRLDVNPLIYLSPLEYPKGTLAIETKTDRDLKSRLKGACLADERWKQELLPALQHAADTAPMPSGSGDTYADPRSYRRALAIVLARYGDLKRARSLYVRELSSRDIQRLENRANQNVPRQRRCSS